MLDFIYKHVHTSQGDTFQLGIGYLDKKLYGEGGFFIMLGYYYINFWERDEA